MTPCYFLDESGDPGLTGESGSSPYLAVTIVELATREPLPLFAAIREKLHLPCDFEFKYHGSKLKQREVFFSALPYLSFSVRAALVEKTAIFDNWNDLDGEDRLVDLAARLVVRSFDTAPTRGVLVIDGAKLRYLRALRKRLAESQRQESKARPFGKIIAGDSAREDGLQLADMVVGALKDAVMHGKDQWLQPIKHRFKYLWVESLREDKKHPRLSL